MDAGAGDQADYRAPEISDYGTLAQLTGDGAPLLMRQLGVVGAAQLATAPTAPGDGGGGGGGGGGAIAGVGGTPEAPLESAAPESPGVGGEVVEPGESAEGGPAGEPGVEAVTGEPGAGGEQVAGADELPFTGLDVAATAALGAATTAAGIALRKALDPDAG